MFALRFHQWNVADQVERLVLDGRFPAEQGRSVFGLDDGFHRRLPGAFDGQRIAGHQIRAGDLQVDGRLPVRLIFGVENPLCGGLVPCLETFLFAGRIVWDEKIPLLR